MIPSSMYMKIMYKIRIETFHPYFSFFLVAVLKLEVSLYVRCDQPKAKIDRKFLKSIFQDEFNDFIHGINLCNA